MRFTNKWAASIAATLFTAMLSACSSGGGGPAPAEYTGSTAQANITSSNSEEIAESIADGASGADATANASSGQTKDDEQLVGAMRSIRSAILKSDKSKYTSQSADTAAVQSLSTTDTSACGGSVSYSFSFDDVTGDLNGSFRFSNYVDCVDNSKMNGSMTVSGTLDLNTYDIPSMTATFSALNYTDASESMTMTGNMAFVTLSATSYKATMNMDFRDENAGVTFRVENYIALATTDHLTYEDVDLSGKFYHPDYGYVTLTTTTVLRINFPDENPTSGVVELVGASGKARLTMTSNDTYTLDIDEDSNDVYEISKSCTWSTNTCI